MQDYCYKSLAGLGRRVGDPPKDEAEHFMRCLVCGGWVDMRDLGRFSSTKGLSLPKTPSGGVAAVTGDGSPVRSVADRGSINRFAA
jgi:hypothetical protein